jgi:hypothetical protein
MGRWLTLPHRHGPGKSPSNYLPAAEAYLILRRCGAVVKERGSLNWMDYADQVRLDRTHLLGEPAAFGVLGVKVAFAPTSGRVIGRFKTGARRGHAGLRSREGGLCRSLPGAVVSRRMRASCPQNSRRAIRWSSGACWPGWRPSAAWRASWNRLDRGPAEPPEEQRD